MAGEAFGEEKIAAQRFAERLHAARLVDGAADDGEVEASRGADIAIDDLAEMEDEVERERRLAVRLAPGIELGIACPRHERRFDRPGAGLGSIGAIDGEDGEQAVAQEFQDLAAPLDDCRADDIEMLVEPAYDLLRGCAVHE